MKKICLFNFPGISNLGSYKIESFDPMPYFQDKPHWSVSDLIVWGLNGYDHRRALTASAAGVDRLYREKNPNYMKMVSDFIDRFRDFDLIVMSTYNFIHPEILATELKKPIKVLGFIDDPFSTYRSGIPYLWAFDGAFYISPSYLGGLSFSDALAQWSSKPSTWWPLVPNKFSKPDMADDAFFRQRDVDVIYVGNPTASKVDRLITLKRHFGGRMKIHGRWPFKGYIGMIRGLLGKPVYPHKVTSLNSTERTSLYWNTKIGFNMHVSESTNETGNMRMYETPAHGMMMVCDKAGGGAHESIFTSNVEAIYYDNINHAIETIEYYLKNEEERISIAKCGYEKFWNNYESEENLLKFLDWACNLRTASN